MGLATDLRPPLCTDERKRQMDEKDRLREIAKEKQNQELLVTSFFCPLL
jgi:hypothetical protein